MTQRLTQIVIVVGGMAVCSTMCLNLRAADTASFPQPLKASEWALVWQDEFSGSTLNETKWRYCPEWKRCDGHCQWSEEDAYVNGAGQLALRIRNCDGDIRCGAVRTKGLFERTYGYFEIRCQVPVIEGGWCAFWMMPASGNRPGNEGRDGTEIDIFESIRATQGRVNHALHWDGYGKEHKKDVCQMDDRPYLYEGYHTYAVLWSEKEYVFYIDGQETWRTSSGGVMQVPAYLKISLEAAKWSGDIFQETLPKEMLVDYVRVYDRKENLVSTPINRVATKQPYVALTFDDGPDPYVLPKLLDLFKKEVVQVTFYLCGENARKYPELVKRIHNEGHEIGNHSLTHPKLPECADVAAVRYEIVETQKILSELIGQTPATFRAPHLAYDGKVWTVVLELGLPSINCSLGTRDWNSSVSKQQILERATANVSAGDIILCHSWRDQTLAAMPEIIATYKAKGLQMVSVSKLRASAR